ncbi:MAG: major capsid protein [Gammaproteobacteria bacterium]|nr:major capsid protein [Gammaproteobacteria bacterium]
MAQPTPTDVHIDAALSNVSIAYKNEAYVADQLFPVVPVDKQSDYYFVFTKDFWFRNSVERRGPGSKYAEGGIQLSSTQFVCVNKGLSFPLPRETVENQDAAVDLETAGAEWLADQFMLDREIALAAKIFDASAWTSSTTLSGTSQWSDYANSDPIGDINTGMEAVKKLTGRYPNTMLMGAEVWDKLKFHPDLLDIYKHTNAAILTTEMVGKVFDGLERVIVGSSIYNAGAEGASFDGTYIWPKNVLLAYVAKAPALRTPSAGYTFVWRQNGYMIAIVRVPEDLRRRDVLLADHAFDQKVTGVDCGYEVIDAVA